MNKKEPASDLCPVNKHRHYLIYAGSLSETDEFMRLSYTDQSVAEQSCYATLRGSQVNEDFFSQPQLIRQSCQASPLFSERLTDIAVSALLLQPNLPQNTNGTQILNSFLSWWKLNLRSFG